MAFKACGGVGLDERKRPARGEPRLCSRRRIFVKEGVKSGEWSMVNGEWIKTRLRPFTIFH
jgi:hypothetical protein